MLDGLGGDREPGPRGDLLRAAAPTPVDGRGRDRPLSPWRSPYIQEPAQDTVMSQHDSARVAREGSTHLSADDVALRLGVGRDRVEQLADLGAIERDANGRFDPGDVHRVRLLLAFEEAGVEESRWTLANQSLELALDAREAPLGWCVVRHVDECGVPNTAVKRFMCVLVVR